MKWKLYLEIGEFFVVETTATYNTYNERGKEQPNSFQTPGAGQQELLFITLRDQAPSSM
jgi:hypothetical protein